MTTSTLRHLRYSGMLTAVLIITFPVHAEGQSLKVDGHACHGANYFNGSVLSDYANAAAFLPPDVLAFWSNFLAPEVGVLNTAPGATNALPVTSATPLDSVMATLDLFQLGFGVAAPDPAQVNIPIHDAFTQIDFAGNRDQVPVASPAEHKFTLARNEVWAEPITLEEWNMANGKVTLKCHADGTGSVRIKAKKLIPLATYTVWQVFAVTEGVADPTAPNLVSDASGTPMLAFGPMGGVPNSLIADAKGRAEYRRDLSYCPLDLEDPLMYIALYAHWDHAVYGTFPEQGLAGLPTGVVGGDHLCFPTGDYLLDAE